MKTKNLFVCLSVGLLGVGALVGCGMDEHHVVQPGDKNIESIVIDASSVPTTPIKVGKFDDAGIKCTINYSDGSKDENQPVTSEMVPDDYKHYLNEPGTVTLNIAFRGTTEQPVTTTLTVEFDLYHLQYTTWTGMNEEEKVYSNYKAINYAKVEELALYKTPTGLDTTVEGKFYKWDSWDFDKDSIESPVDKVIHPIYENAHPVSISINEDSIPEEGIKFDKFDEAEITMTVAYSDTTVKDDVPVLASYLEDASELTPTGTDGTHEFKVLYYNDTLSDTFDLDVKSYEATYYALTTESESAADQKLLKTTKFRTALGDITSDYPDVPETVTIATGVTYKHTGWDVEEITSLVDTPVHATYEDVEYYTVNFYKGDSSLINSQLIESGENAVEPSESDRAMTNYAFYGWDRSYQNVTKNINVYGIYFEVEHELSGYTLVSFVVESDEPSFSYLVKTGELVPEPVDPVGEDTFNGWYKEATFENKWDFDVDVATGTSLTLYAEFVHIHVLGELIPAEPATCTELGFDAHYICEDCGAYLNSEMEETTIADLILPLIPHNYNGSGFCNACGVSKFNYEAIKASNSVTYTLNTTEEKPADTAFAEVYDVVSGGAPTSGDWAFFQSDASFASYKKVTFAGKVDASDEFGVNVTGENAGYYHVSNHNGEWVIFNLVNNNGAWTLTVDGADLVKHGTSTVFDSLTLGGATFHDLGLRKNDGAINTALLTEMIGYWNEPGEHVHELDSNSYCDLCDRYVLSYAKNAYSDGNPASLLQKPDSISKASFTGPEESGAFYYHSEATGGGVGSNCFFAHKNLNLGYDHSVNGQEWKSFSFYINSTDANNARIVIPAIENVQATGHLAIPRGCTKVEAKLEELDGTMYYGLYFNDSATRAAYVKRAAYGTLAQNFQILCETGFYITEITYVMGPVA